MSFRCAPSDEGRRWRRFVLLTGAVILLAGLTMGVATAIADSASSPEPASSSKVTLRVGWVNEPDNLNPFIGYSTSSYLIWHLNYDLLTGYKADTVATAPELAESWTHSTDSRVWTFKIRQGVTWQDGEPFTARDVAFTDDYTAVFTCSKPKADILGMWIPIVPEHISSHVDPKEAQRS